MSQARAEAAKPSEIVHDAKCPVCGRLDVEPPIKPAQAAKLLGVAYRTHLGTTESELLDFRIWPNRVPLKMRMSLAMTLEEFGRAAQWADGERVGLELRQLTEARIKAHERDTTIIFRELSSAERKERQRERFESLLTQSPPPDASSPCDN